MDVRQLEAFVVVADEQHFHRAALRLGTTQPSLSRQIGSLEAELGVQLFERLPRGVRLSQAGRAFQADAVAVLAQLGRAVQRVRRVAAGQEGSLALGFVETTMRGPEIPRVLQVFRQQHHGIAVDLRPMSSLRQWESLRNRGIDVGFAFDAPLDATDLEHERLVEDSIVLAVPEQHPLATAPRVTLAMLRHEPFVWFERHDAPAYYDRVNTACERAGLQLQVVQLSLHNATAMALVAAGLGLTFALASSRHARPVAVVLREVEDLHVPMHIQALWRRGEASAAVHAFLDVARAVRDGTI
jgi:DNA-binding transcriptional LysR family regulator